MPVLQLILFKLTKKLNKSSKNHSLSKQVYYCDNCEQVAIIPVIGLLKDKTKQYILCYYCYNLNQNFYSDMKYVNQNYLNNM